MSETRKRAVKLVRDEIGQFLDGDGVATYEPVTDPAEMVALLKAKLIEEVGEYLIDPSMGELADIYAVVDALAFHVHGEEMSEVERLASLKHMERGGFYNGVVMYVQSNAPTTHEGDKADG